MKQSFDDLFHMQTDLHKRISYVMTKKIKKLKNFFEKAIQKVPREN